MKLLRSLLSSIILMGLGVGAPALAQNNTFTNPLGSNSFSQLIGSIIQFLSGLIAILTLLALLWGGILYIISLGNDQYVQQAKKIIFWAIVGFSISVLSFAIITTLKGFLGIS